jgi:hypothetical protein
MAGGFICNLVLGIFDFRHKTPRKIHFDSRIAGQAWPKGPDFSEQKKPILHSFPKLIQFLLRHERRMFTYLTI